MNPVREAFHACILGIAVWKWLLIIDITGIVIQMIRYIDRIRRIDLAYRMIVKVAKVTSVGEYLQDHEHREIPVYRSNLVSSPMVIEFKKAIFLPETDFSERENLQYAETLISV